MFSKLSKFFQKYEVKKAKKLWRQEKVQWKLLQFAQHFQIFNDFFSPFLQYFQSFLWKFVKIVKVFGGWGGGGRILTTFTKLKKIFSNFYENAFSDFDYFLNKFLLMFIEI